MAKKNYYAVKVGKTPGIYRTWDECKENVTGYPGAVYKGFEKLGDAEAFLGNSQEKVVEESLENSRLDNETDQSREMHEEIISHMKKTNPGCEAIAFVDGSFDSRTGEFGYGCLILSGEDYYEFYEKNFDTELSSMHNVAGEIEGSKKAMSFCVEHGIKSLALCYDYAGIEKWCTGEWKATKEGTKKYRKYYLGIKDRVNVTFIKIEGHSGDPGNDRADELARKSLGK